MNQSSSIPGCKEIAQNIKGQKPPYKCPACLKYYKSITGIFYHIGQLGPPTNVPRCLIEETPKATPHFQPNKSPKSSSVIGTGSSVRRKARRELTWGEAQQFVEAEFDNSYRRVEIDNDLELMEEEQHSIADERGSGSIIGGKRKRGMTPRTPQKRGRGATAVEINETPSRRGSGKPVKLPSTGKDKVKWRSKQQSGKGVTTVTLPIVDVSIVEGLDFPDGPGKESSYYRFVEQSAEDLDENIEYDMDEEDYHWLSLMNEDRKSQGLTSVPQDVFEILMDRLEKECVFESQTSGESVELPGNNFFNIDENAVCCICNDGECHNTNAILFCDMCNLAVHQECYGVPYIPEGQWLCRRCIESPSRGVDCALCPNKIGAFKQTLDGRWAHVTCAIWIPEVQFANAVFLEPIEGIKEIPAARWKLTCYICRRRMGACIQCAKANCCVAFHVTCAQQACLYMKLEPTKGGDFKKIAYCDAHTPSSVKRKMAKAAREQEQSKAQEEKAARETDEIMLTNGRDEKEGDEMADAIDVLTEKKVDNEEEVVLEEEAAVNAPSVEGDKQEEEEGGGSEGEREGEKMAAKPRRTVSSNVIKARKMMEERIGYNNVPVVNIPYVPQHR